LSSILVVQTPNLKRRQKKKYKQKEINTRCTSYTRFSRNYCWVRYRQYSKTVCLLPVIVLSWVIAAATTTTQVEESRGPAAISRGRRWRRRIESGVQVEEAGALVVHGSTRRRHEVRRWRRWMVERGWVLVRVRGRGEARPAMCIRPSATPSAAPAIGPGGDLGDAIVPFRFDPGVRGV